MTALRKVNINIALSNLDICKPIKGYEKYYIVTYNGMVYSKISNKFLSPGITKATGYKSVVLYCGEKPKCTKYVHRLVAESFIPSINGKDVVNHKSGYKLNNHVSNLDWCSSLENNRHAIDTGLRSVKCKPDIIESIISEHIKGDSIYGAKALSIKYKLDKSVIHDLLNKYKYKK